MIASALAIAEAVARFALWCLAFAWMPLIYFVLPDFRADRPGRRHDKMSDLQGLIFLAGWISIAVVFFTYVVPSAIDPFCRSCKSPFDL